MRPPTSRRTHRALSGANWRRRKRCRPVGHDGTTRSSNTFARPADASIAADDGLPSSSATAPCRRSQKPVPARLLRPPPDCSEATGSENSGPAPSAAGAPAAAARRSRVSRRASAGSVAPRRGKVRPSHCASSRARTARGPTDAGCDHPRRLPLGTTRYCPHGNGEVQLAYAESSVTDSWNQLLFDERRLTAPPRRNAPPAAAAPEDAGQTVVQASEAATVVPPVADVEPAGQAGSPASVAAAAAKLEKQVRTHAADFQRWQSVNRTRSRRLAAAAVAVGAPCLLALGLLLPAQFAILPAPDPTNGWRDFVWNRFGSEIADCVLRARAAGKRSACEIVVP